MIGSAKYRAWLQHPGFNGGGKGDAPEAPDYAKAAEATAAGNVDAVRAQAAANRVNQYTPQGSLVYSRQPGAFDQAGYDAALSAYQQQLAIYQQEKQASEQNGTSFDVLGLDKPKAPKYDDYLGMDDTWTATQTYSPDQQAIYQGNVDLTKGLLGTAKTGLDEVDRMLGNPAIDESRLARMPTNPGESYMDAAMRYMQPTQDRQREQLRTQLANQGITMGSEAYGNAMGDQADQFDRANLQATMMGMDKNMLARQQGIQEQNYVNTYPLNIINALRTGNQVQSPSFVNVPQQGYAAGPDLLGAAQSQYQGELGQYNANQAASGNVMSGLFGLGSAALGSPWLFS